MNTRKAIKECCKLLQNAYEKDYGRKLTNESEIKFICGELVVYMLVKTQ